MPVQVPPEDIEAFQQGNESVLTKLVQTLGPYIESVLRERFPLLRPYTEDLLVDTLYRAWMRRREFDQKKGALSNWLLVIALNAACDLLRTGWQQVRAFEAELAEGSLEQIAETRDLTDGLADGREGNSPKSLASGSVGEEQAFWEVLNSLPEVDRRIILYHAQVNGTGSWAVDLAGELGLTAGNIRVRRGRILKRICDELTRRGYPTKRGSVTDSGRLAEGLPSPGPAGNECRA
jgi:RNA polymerase sigma factor (sigma-70 family)